MKIKKFTKGILPGFLTNHFKAVGDLISPHTLSNHAANRKEFVLQCMSQKKGVLFSALDEAGDFDFAKTYGIAVEIGNVLDQYRGKIEITSHYDHHAIGVAHGVHLETALNKGGEYLKKYQNTFNHEMAVIIYELALRDGYEPVIIGGIHVPRSFEKGRFSGRDIQIPQAPLPPPGGNRRFDPN